jgi:sugar phosphate isomerase/epimerase
VKLLTYAFTTRTRRENRLASTSTAPERAADVARRAGAARARVCVGRGAKGSTGLPRKAGEACRRAAGVAAEVCRTAAQEMQ